MRTSGEHINVREVRAACRAMAAGAVAQPDSRGLYLHDSRVTIGAAAKGRSASRLLNGILSRTAPTLVACNHYPGHDFTPTRLQPADDPTRARELRG